MDFIELSKTISHALRHEPSIYGLKLDPQGWVRVEDLLEALRKKRTEWASLTQKDIIEFIRTSKKKRFEIKAHWIRAYYGHSTQEKLEKQAIEPPAILFHGTSAESAALIMQEGLKPCGRQYVHLSLDKETALVVGRRKSSMPVLLIIDAKEASAHGVKFYLGNETVWLSDFISPRFIKIIN